MEGKESEILAGQVMKLAEKVPLLCAALFSIANPAFCDSAQDYLSSGIAKRTAGDLDGAIGDFTKVIELKSDLAEAYRNRGVAKRTKGALDPAMLDFNKAIELK